MGISAECGFRRGGGAKKEGRFVTYEIFRVLLDSRSDVADKVSITTLKKYDIFLTTEKKYLHGKIFY